MLYSAPLLALALLFTVYYFATLSAQAKIDFTVPIAIQISHLVQGQAYVSNALPVNVGIRGGIWAYHQYDSDGVNGHYPVFASEGTNGNTSYSFIHVRSTVNRTYTLQDFFNVWGAPLGPKNTLGYTAPPPTSDTSYTSDWYWDMCVQLNGGRIHEGIWGNQTLVPGLGIVLRYSNSGCLPIT